MQHRGWYKKWGQVKLRDKLFSLVCIGRAEIKNRVAMTPMGVNLAGGGRIVDATTDAFGQAFVFEP